MTDLNLGIKRPLGQKLISPKLFSPLGAKKLSNSNISILLNSETKDSSPVDILSESQSQVFKNLAKAASNTKPSSNTNPSTNSTVIQPQTEIPQLPKALKKISTFQPIPEPSNLVVNQIDSVNVSPRSSYPTTHHIQKVSEQDIPDSWSNIAELFGKSEVDIVQPLTIASTQSQHSKNQKNKTSSQVIQAYTSSETSTSVESIESDSLINEDSVSEDELANLETLAREVYKMLKQRLEIQRERRGNNYSGRLPW